MKAQLIIFKLKVKSSYNQNIELPADSSFDTLQFFAQDKIIMRIKTFALDHDIHIHTIQLRGKTMDEMIDFLATSTNNHYGDIVDRELHLEIENPKEHEAIKAMFVKESLTPHIDTLPDFIFWNPDNKKYRTQSKPL